jgi:energy-coupling factor transporter ATP-binding protein EcfA2
MPIREHSRPPAPLTSCSQRRWVSMSHWPSEPPTGPAANAAASARGILAACGSDIVLMDEPTASLDPATEARVYTNLFAAFADACVISSVHRLSLLDRFDEILMMHEGRLVAQGSIDDLALTYPSFSGLPACRPSAPSRCRFERSMRALRDQIGTDHCAARCPEKIFRAYHLDHSLL